jgi:hypothetical protein
MPDWALRDLTPFAGSFRTESGLARGPREPGQAAYGPRGSRPIKEWRPWSCGNLV